jgi:DNA-binding CsgD family transcriptional regulator
VQNRRLPRASTRTYKPRPPAFAKLSLTPREEQILYWIAQGKSNAQIAKILAISAATVSKHLEHIYPKLGVENRTAAASFVPRPKL